MSAAYLISINILWAHVRCHYYIQFDIYTVLWMNKFNLYVNVAWWGDI